MNVSRETFLRLETYHQLLQVWQRNINLVAASTLPHAWERHFEDSLQLLSYLPLEETSLVDLGSGAGFPGLVLAIARPETLKVTLVESDFKKCLFLETVSRETKTKVTLLRKRIESCQGDIKADVVTARGLSPLPLLLEYASSFMKENSTALFLKGKEAQQEIQEALKKWEFDLEIFPSLTDSRSSILKIKHLNKASFL